MLYILNRFSLSMLDWESQRGTPRGYLPLPADAPMQMARLPRPCDNPCQLIEAFEDHDMHIVSAVDDADMARLFSDVLDRDIEHRKIEFRLMYEDVALVGQYVDPPLPDNATELPADATIEWWTI